MICQDKAKFCFGHFYYLDFLETTVVPLFFSFVKINTQETRDQTQEVFGLASCFAQMKSCWVKWYLSIYFVCV